jgi:putative heme-binding domain-containing protein
MNLGRISWISCLCLAALARAEEELGPELVARTPPLAPEEERLKLRLPPGFEVQLVAAEPDIQKPMNLAFDERGRLWATGSVEYPFGAKEGETPRDSIKIFEDLDGDGRADKVTVFADGLNIPIGLLPLHDGAIVYSIPPRTKDPGKLYRLIDTDGDSRADERRELYGDFAHVDTHGMINGLRAAVDGWIYACHGYSNTSEVKGKDGQAIRMNSGNTFRMRPDGSHVEQFTHGQVNPFGIAFDDLGNLYSADCHSQPGYLLVRNGWYPSFGKPHDGLGFAPTLMEHDHGSTAICGVVYYSAGDFPPEYRDTLFLGNVVTNRINHDRLERRGSTRKAVLQPDFLVSDDPWFRPVDLQLGPDGALYVADFYNRIIGHYEVSLTHPGRDRERGRIWRIVYRGKEGSARPRPPADLTRASVADLLASLAEENLTVRTRATNELVRRGGAAVVDAARAGLRSPSRWVRTHCLWVLDRLGSLEAEALQAAARDPEAVVRVHLQRVLAERPALAEPERALVLAALSDRDADVARAAAEALQTHPRPEDLGPVLSLRKLAPAEDRLLVHVARLTIREQLRSPTAWEKVSGLPEDGLSIIADVAPGVHTPESASFLLRRLERREKEKADAPPGEQVTFLARYLPEEARESLERLVREYPAGTSRRVALLTALQNGTEERGSKLGAATLSFARELVIGLFRSGDSGKVRAGIDLVRGLKLKGLEEELLAIVRARDAAQENRRLCLETLVAIDPRGQVQLLREFLSDGTESFAFREHAAAELGNIREAAAVEALASEISVAPAGLAARIAAAMSRSREGAEGLLAVIERGKASARLLRGREVAGRLSRSGIEGVKERVEKLNADLPETDGAVEKLIAARKQAFTGATPDPRKGEAVFEKTCAPCHRLGEKGKKIGPELAGIGLRGADRLLEDILDPSRNVDRAFSTTVVVLRNNLVRTGLLLNEEGEVLVLADSEGKEVRIPRADVKNRELSLVSPMPANVAETVPEADFYDLLAFLLSQREKKEPAAGAEKR